MFTVMSCKTLITIKCLVDVHTRNILFSTMFSVTLINAHYMEY